MLMPLPDLKGPTDIICAQFERFDGSGFPEKKSGDHIPIGARILAVASDYDGMQIGTMTQRKLTPEDARIIVTHGSGKRYDPDVVNALVELLGGGSREEADTGKVGEMAVLADDLEVGMALARDLITPSGMLMLSTGHVLDQRLIDKIRRFQKSCGMELTAFIQVQRTH